MRKIRKTCLIILTAICCVFIFYYFALDEINILYIKHSNIEQDVLKSINDNDLRFYVYLRLGLNIPGIQDFYGRQKAIELINKYGYKKLKGFSCTEGFGRYYDVLIEYASRNNLRLMWQIERTNEN